jgi:hypothetical protein
MTIKKRPGGQIKEEGTFDKDHWRFVLLIMKAIMV